MYIFCIQVCIQDCTNIWLFSSQPFQVPAMPCMSIDKGSWHLWCQKCLQSLSLATFLQIPLAIVCMLGMKPIKRKPQSLLSAKRIFKLGATCYLELYSCFSQAAWMGAQLLWADSILLSESTPFLCLHVTA